MDDQRTALTRRITFAEGWLDRARQQVEDGEQTRGVLTLLLAEAEVHRARELGTAEAVTAPEHRRAMLGPVVAAVAAATIVAAVAIWRPFGPAAWGTAAASDVSPHPIVSLAAGHGTLLNLVQAPEVIERIMTVPTAVRVTVRGQAQRMLVEPAIVVPSPTVAGTAPAPRRLEGAPASATAPASAAAPAVVESSNLLSEAELIDLVLATERSLRRSTNQ